MTVGLGPLAGVLALFVHNTGIIAKLFSEAVEAIDPRPVEGIRATGATRLQEVIFGVIPQVLPMWSSLTLYRFETNVRSATVLGIVGAGGIGQSLYENIRSFNYSETSTIIIIVLAVMLIGHGECAIAQAAGLTRRPSVAMVAASQSWARLVEAGLGGARLPLYPQDGGQVCETMVGVGDLNSRPPAPEASGRPARPRRFTRFRRLSGAKKPK
ncbi:MAG: ABC transporter permease subunit [Hyphomicrobiaceae bacterium]